MRGAFLAVVAVVSLPIAMTRPSTMHKVHTMVMGPIVVEGQVFVAGFVNDTEATAAASTSRSFTSAALDMAMAPAVATETVDVAPPVPVQAFVGVPMPLPPDREEAQVRPASPRRHVPRPAPCQHRERE